jgi:hypothetical protein
MPRCNIKWNREFLSRAGNGSVSRDRRDHNRLLMSKIAMRPTKHADTPT